MVLRILSKTYESSCRNALTIPSELSAHLIFRIIKIAIPCTMTQ